MSTVNVLMEASCSEYYCVHRHLYLSIVLHCGVKFTPDMMGWDSIKTDLHKEHTSQLSMLDPKEEHPGTFIT